MSMSETREGGIVEENISEILKVRRDKLARLREEGRIPLNNKIYPYT